MRGFTALVKLYQWVDNLDSDLSSLSQAIECPLNIQKCQVGKTLTNGCSFQFYVCFIKVLTGILKVQSSFQKLY